MGFLMYNFYSFYGNWKMMRFLKDWLLLNWTFPLKVAK